MPATSAISWRRSLGIALALVLAFVVVCGAPACVANPAPERWLAPATAARTDPYGAWIVITKVGDSSEVSGEFLAVGRDSVFVLLEDSTVRSLPTDSVATAQVAFYDAQWDQLTMWTVAGALGTISNGAFLILSLPVTVIGGTIATRNTSREPIRMVDGPGGWDAVRMYARFPAGLPENLPRRLPPKPRG